MKLVLLVGSGAVGKMTVGQALAKKTGLRLFHNHMMIEPVIEVFGTYNGTAVQRLRQVVFEEFLKTELPGLIFTFMWAFDQPEDGAYILSLKEMFAQRGAETYCVELTAPQKIRLEWNRTENRLLHKASKRDTAVSERRLLSEDAQYRLISRAGEIPFANYLRLDNSALSPEEAAERICLHFGFEIMEKEKTLDKEEEGIQLC